jgi:CheY-like chemotaxis protein
MTYEKSCLLIDDDRDDQMVFSIVIGKLNKSVLCVAVDDGPKAIQKLQDDLEFRPDIIFLDLNLPGMTGIDCLRKIKQIKKISHIPIVIYTTSSRREDIQKTKDLGAIAFISKSYHIKDLIGKLNLLF